MIRRTDDVPSLPPAAESAPFEIDDSSSAFHARLSEFGGPLDLLLYLIHKNEVDIFDIPIAEILGQYLEHIRVLQKNGLLRLNEAGEFLVMAARLMEIKSKMLLPAPEIEQDEVLEEELEDPRRSLVVELLAYRETKERAILLESAFMSMPDGRVTMGMYENVVA